MTASLLQPRYANKQKKQLGLSFICVSHSVETLFTRNISYEILLLSEPNITLTRCYSLKVATLQDEDTHDRVLLPVHLLAPRNGL